MEATKIPVPPDTLDELEKLLTEIGAHNWAWSISAKQFLEDLKPCRQRPSHQGIPVEETTLIAVGRLLIELENKNREYGPRAKPLLERIANQISASKTATADC
jgi:hypothetical protein